MKIKLPENAKKILDTMHEAGFEAYVVGGAVCLAIGAIYSAVMKRMAKEGSVQQSGSEMGVNF